MRYIIYGAGAVGGAIGGRLFQAGHDVVLICRGAHLAAIRADGLLLRTPEGDHRLRVPAVGHPAELTFTDDDAVVLTMKTQDTERALHDLTVAGGGHVPVVCAQNGVENERIAARRFARVYGMLVALPATFLTPGEVIAEGTPITGVLHLGRYPQGSDRIAEQIARDITASTMLAEVDPAVMRLKYSKLLANLGNATQIVIGPIRGSDDARALMAMVREEAVTLYERAGIAYASDEEYRERVSQFLRVGDVAGMKRGGSSTWQSIQRGHTTIEADYLNGEITLLAALHGGSAPLNRVVQQQAVLLAARRTDAPPLSAADLRAMAAASEDTAPAVR